MAIFHCHISTVSRAKGRSAVDAAAYALHSVLTDQRTGTTHNRLLHAEAACIADLGTYAPDGTALNPTALWSAAELAEKRKDSRTARTLEIALPVELPQEAQDRLAVDFAAWLRSTYQVATTVGVHRQQAHNPHAHIVITTRRMAPDGSLGKKTEELDRGKCRDKMKRIRAQWANLCNAALEAAGEAARVSSLSLAAQGIDRAPQAHRGIKQHAADLAKLGLTRAEYAKLQETKHATDPGRKADHTKHQPEDFAQRDPSHTANADGSYHLDTGTTRSNQLSPGSLERPGQLGRIADPAGNQRSDRSPGSGLDAGLAESLPDIKPIPELTPLPIMTDFGPPDLGKRIASRIDGLRYTRAMAWRHYSRIGQRIADRLDALHIHRLAARLNHHSGDADNGNNHTDPAYSPANGPR